MLFNAVRNSLLEPSVWLLSEKGQGSQPASRASLQQRKICFARRSHTVLVLFRRRSGRNTGYFLPLGIDCGRKLVHLLEEHRDFPDLLVLQRGSKARHCREADSMLNLPERDSLRIILDPVLGKLRGLDIEALSQVRRLGVRCAMAYRAIFGVQMHTGDQILVTRLNGIREPFRVALERGMQRRRLRPTVPGRGACYPRSRVRSLP